MGEFILHTQSQTVTLDLSPNLIFFGSNRGFKENLYTKIKRISQGTAWSDVETDYYGEDGMQLMLNGKRVTTKSMSFINIESEQSLLEQIGNGKKSLLMHRLMHISQDIQCAYYIEQVNDTLSALEIWLNQKLREDVASLGVQLADMTIEQILSKQLATIFRDGDIEVPSYEMDTAELVDIFIKLLTSWLSVTEVPVLLQLKYPETFVEHVHLKQFIQRLIALGHETKRLYLIIYHHWEGEFYTQNDVQYCVVCFDTYQQMPEFEIFKMSIARHYPSMAIMSDEEMTDGFYRIANKIGDTIKCNDFILHKDMVLLKVLNKLLDIDVRLETSGELDNIEIAYLNDR